MGSGAFLVEACRQLAEELIKAWYAHDLVPKDIPPDEDELLYARRMIAQRCLYGVDKNIMAVDLAKLSLWLVTLAKAHPFTFLDHSLRYGDSLVGLTRQQIIGFHWEPGKQKKFGEDLIQKRLDKATESRAKILNAREDVAYRDQETRLAVADEALNVVRLTGDTCVSAFFAGSKPKEREQRCNELFQQVSDWYTSGFDINKRNPIATAANSLRCGEHPIPPFHWEIEFPEVFSRENEGFDAIVGNPPFLGGSKISGALGKALLDWIMELTPQSHGNSDFVAYFFRRCFEKIRQRGTAGLIASNTIAQGDTRQTGLAFICENGGTIFNAVRRMKWPGQAAVVVSKVFFRKREHSTNGILDGKSVEKITAFLFTSGGNTNPHTLKQSCGLCFKGVDINGMGFTFDDDDPKGVATPISVLENLRDVASSKVSIVRPFIGGQELNNDPKFRPSRFVINFGNRPLSECESKWPELVQITTEKVKPERMKKSEKKLREFWWKFGRRRDDLFLAIADLETVTVTAETSPHHSFAFLPSDYIYAQSLRVFAFDSLELFAVLQCRCHEMWARCFGSSMKDDLRYTPTDCFETFPMPPSDAIKSLENVGRRYYDTRSGVMVSTNGGLTSLYNRFHDPHEQSSDILHLRELHAAMDRAVLEAYGWHDLAQTARCEFLLDYEDEDESEDGDQGSGTGRRQKKKPWRLRWPDDFRDEVLARLLELNEQRHKEELLAGKAGVGVRVSGVGDESDEDEQSDPDTDEEADSPKPKKTATKSTPKPRAPRKSKKSPATGQQEMDF